MEMETTFKMFLCFIDQSHGIQSLLIYVTEKVLSIIFTMVSTYEQSQINGWASWAAAQDANLYGTLRHH
jgi:hypothetical protein